MAPRWLILSLALVSPVQAQRTAVQQVLSDSAPRIRVTVDSSFGFLGRVHFPVGTGAEAEQFVYGDIERGRLVRAVIVHFERFFPATDARFIYPAEPADTLGGHAYLHQHWWLGSDFLAPGVRALLDRRGILADSAYVADRHVRVTDSAGKHEIIIFYLEGWSTFAEPVERVPPTLAGNVPPAIAREIAQRARRAFRVRD